MRYLLLLAAALSARGQGSPGLGIHSEGTRPKASAAEYPVRAESGNLTIGAEYTVHSFGSGEEMYLAENYLVVEVALFPPKGESVAADAGKFELRVNGKKTLLHAQRPQMVVGRLSHSDWGTPRRTVTADVGVGGVDIGMGHPQRRDPVTGAPEGRRLPDPPPAPNAEVPGGTRQRERPEDLLVRTALPEEPLRGPVSGFLYFPYAGKASGVKSLELLFQDAAMKLR